MMSLLFRRGVVLVAIVVAAGLPAAAQAASLRSGPAPLLAQQQQQEEVAPDQPPVKVEPEAPAPEERPWTTRFLIPTALLLGVVTTLVTIVLYFVRVTRTRYRVVK